MNASKIATSRISHLFVFICTLTLCIGGGLAGCMNFADAGFSRSIPAIRNDPKDFQSNAELFGNPSVSPSPSPSPSPPDDDHGEKDPSKKKAKTRPRRSDSEANRYGENAGGERKKPIRE